MHNYNLYEENTHEIHGNVFRRWFGAVRQQAISWTGIDEDHLDSMVSAGCRELIN